MKISTAFRFWAPAVLLGAASLTPQMAGQTTQTPPAATQPLLEKAHALEVRGRMDMAAQTWQQVLLADPSNTEALGGLARAARLAGNQALASMYIDRLRAINPNDPNIARAENLGTQLDHNVQLQLAGKLAQQGKYAEAMTIYRQVYGDTPPAGDMALAYYETEAATEEGRPHAIAGLRGLVAKNPGDSRFQVALGRILTYNPKTRAEGRKLLEAHPGDPQAVEALRQSLLWDAQNPATTAEINEYLSRHQDAQLSQALQAMPKQAAPARPQTAAERAAAEANATRSAEDSAAYRALNAKHLEEAESRFKAILANEPNSPNALAGMGYLRMQQANFSGAISYLEGAKQNGSKDPGVEPALTTSRFWSTMAEGATSLNENDLPAAEKRYRAALALRPQSPEALEALGGTLLKAQQAAAAAPYFAEFIKVRPSAAHAWRGLFLSQYGAGDTVHALATERAMPAAVRTELAKDPLYLRALSSAYSAAGKDADAQRVLKAALDLPFPADARGVEAETQLQYAGLLQAANHLDQAAGLYRQVVAKDTNNTDAWQGLVRVQHAMNQDADALQTVESMPPTSYAKAMREPGFEATVASLYQGQKRADVAQEILEKAIAQQVTGGQKPSSPMQLQLAAIYLERNNPQQAYPLYRQVLTDNPERTEAWRGLLSSLHNTGRDQEALAEVQQIPATVKAQLEDDPEFLQTIGSVYNALGQSQQAQVYLRRVQQHYAQQHAEAPADVDIQNGWLLYNGANDAGLYKQLLMLGGRTDLTDAQRRTVQTIWANWAVRRANQAAANGNNSRALAILNATARAFPDNPGVIKALAGGYSRAGMSKQAVLIWKAQDMTTAPASDYKAAVGAALAANDTKSAETWLRFALDQYPKDPDLLILGARFEQAQGNNNRAADYYRASLDAMPPPDPGAELATELSRPVPAATTMHLPNVKAAGGGKAQDLAALLSPTTNDDAATPQVPTTPVSTQPYLPSMNSGFGSAPVQLGVQGTVGGSATDMTVVPSYMTAPAPAAQPAKPASVPRTRLRDYVPQAALDQPLPADATELPVAAAGSGDGMLVLTPAVYQREQVVRATERAQQAQARVFAETAGFATGGGLQPERSDAPVLLAQNNVRPGPLTTQPTTRGGSQPAGQAAAGQAAGQSSAAGTYSPAVNPTTVDPVTGEVYGAYVPYKPPTAVAVQLGSTPPTHQIAQPELTDVLPTAKYVPNAKGRPVRQVPADVAAANAAAIRRRQSVPPPVTGESKPPAEDYATVPAQNAQYTTNAGQQTNQGRSAPGVSSSLPPNQTGDSDAQQYPQPYVPSRGRTRAARQTAAPVTTAPAPAVSTGLSYPGIAQPLGSQPYPAIGAAYPLGQAPTDADLVAQHVPPLRGRYYTGEMLAPAIPLTPRQQAEKDLATLEASYSGWAGGTGAARYRSGTVGLDRLTDLESTMEASVVFGNNLRLTVVPKTVFLNSGTLDLTQYSGVTSGVPVVGTFPLNAVNQPSQQSVSGVGGELQIAGRNFAAAAGYTPYEFLVRNITGRFAYKPNQHITLFGNRDSVTETQLSYAGLRDPGSVSAVYAGNVWGGVVATGGGLRFDYGDERAGLYITADGSDFTGYHVLENNKFEGSAGAYFLVHAFPGIGRLNAGASIFGMHYKYNERGLSYGLGGYFSPDAYFLASIPITFTGHSGSNFHYTINGSFGVQTFQEDSQLFFPLDRGLQSSYAATANGGAPCTTAQTAAHTCAQYPVNSNTGGNYGINAEAAYRIANHWFAGGFLSANNTNNYNTVTGGFFVRYLFRPQYGTDDYPTGLFPVEGFRPLRVP